MLEARPRRKTTPPPLHLPPNPYYHVDRVAEATGGIAALRLLARDGLNRLISDISPQSAIERRLIEHQRSLALKMGLIIGNAVRREYGVTGIGEDIGSFSRATNDGPTPDIDLMIVGIPKQGGFVDWTNLDTHSITGSWEGIVNLDDILPATADAHLLNAIKTCLGELSKYFADPRFNWVRSWEDFPGVVFNVSVIDPEYGRLDYDINLYHEPDYFGAQHGIRFNCYIDTLRFRDGISVAWQVLKDIKRLKGECKAAAKTAQGKVDKTLKVPGFIAESLFTFNPEPIDYKTLMKLIVASQLTPAEIETLPTAIQNNIKQFVLVPGTSIRDIFQSMTRGGYRSLLAIASRA